MLDDLSTDAFINELRCFIAIRGKIREIHCDCDTNFVGARNELKLALQEITDEEKVAAFLAKEDCDFKMNTPICEPHGRGLGTANQNHKKHT